MPNKVAFLIILLVLGFVVYNNFVYRDESADCNIRIVPSIFIPNWNTKETLRVLKYGDPAQYALLCKNVNKIIIDSNCGGFDGGCYYHGKSNTIYIGPDTRDIGLASAIIGHETCHVIQEKEKRPFSENECYDVLRDIYKKLINI